MPQMTRRTFVASLPALAASTRLLARAQSASIPVRGLHQVTLAVSDVDRSLEFYQGLFGMPVQARHGSKVLLGIGDGPHFLALTDAGSGPPRIDHFGMAVEDFDADRVVRMLADHGVTQGGGGQGLSGGPGRVRVSTRGNTTEVHMGDPSGLVIQLQDPRYCGGGGPADDTCGPSEPAPSSGSLALRGLSHLTINVPDPAATNEFFQQTFGFGIQAYQAAAPLLGAGPGEHFLMFIGSGRAPQAGINHACLTLDDFDVEHIQGALEAYGLTPRGEPRAAGPLRHWVSMRMPNRGGAPEGTPELYFSDPDGLSIQLQDMAYCGGGGYLGSECA
jgi:catechol 2,3-dioxygenase-like lactoylglutathione lyase family enzyme